MSGSVSVRAVVESWFLLLKGTRSLGERKVFFTLQENLPDSFSGLHGVTLLTRGRSDVARLHDGEIDFVLAHPELGLLVLEVKGGGISCDQRNQRWISSNRDGDFEIKNPYEQAKRNMYALIEELNASKLGKRHSFPIGYAVWFPDIEIGRESLGLSTNLQDITLDAKSLSAPEDELRRIFRSCLVRPASGKPAPSGIEEFVKHFVPNWKIPVRLSSRLNEEEIVLGESTRSQFRVLSMLGRKRRALICGSAGSGKTFIALEKARRVGEKGARALLLCYNSRLAAWLKTAAESYKNVDVFDYHGLCVHLCKLAKMPVPQPDPHGNRESYFKYELPEAMMAALEEISDRYDAVIVDEAQDFDPIWWIGIELLLSDSDENELYLFYDDNQQIYGSRLEFPIAEEPLLLCENCRNTRAIFDGFMEFYRGDVMPESLGPPGDAIEIVKAGSPSDEKRALENVIKRLVHQEQIPAAAITILTGAAQGRSIWKEVATGPASTVYSWKARYAPNVIACSTIHSFKGLESSVIIVSETSGFPMTKIRELLYVAYSRAKFHLIVARD